MKSPHLKAVQKCQRPHVTSGPTLNTKKVFFPKNKKKELFFGWKTFLFRQKFSKAFEVFLWKEKFFFR